MAFYLVMFDLAVVNVAFPDIVTDFGIAKADASWIVSLYNILFGSLLVVAGKTADSLGRRRVFSFGVACFGLGAAVAAVAPSLTYLLIGRTVQGIGAALMLPSALGLLVAIFPLERRTQVMGLWGAVGAFGITCGPSLGAAVIQVTNWRAAFWIPIVVCVGLLVRSGQVLEESPPSVSAHRPDYLGAGVVTAALALVVLGVSRSGTWGWVSLATIASITAGIAGIVVFVLRQRNHPEPILDLTLFRSRSFTVASWSGFVFFGGYGAYNLNNVLFLREAWSYSVLEAGLLALIGPATVAILSPLGGRVAARVGFRIPAIVGALTVGAATFALGTCFDETPNPGLFMVLVCLVGAGIAGFMSINGGASVASLPAERLSVGGAVSNALRQVGAAFGVALLVAVVGTPQNPADIATAHSNGYLLVAGTMLFAAVISVAQTGREGTPIVS